MKKSKRVKKSIQSKIMATALCPLIAMSTSVSVLAVNDADGMLIANVIAGILFVGVAQLLFVSRSIVKSIRKMEEYLNELAEGNLDIVIDERLSKEKDEVGSMSQSLDVLKKILKESMRNIQDISNNLIDLGAKLDQVMGGIELAADQIKTAAGKIYMDMRPEPEDGKGMVIPFGSGPALSIQALLVKTCI